MGFQKKRLESGKIGSFRRGISLQSTDNNVTVAFKKCHRWKKKSKQFQWVMAIMCDTSQEEVWQNVFKIERDADFCNKALNNTGFAA